LYNRKKNKQKKKIRKNIIGFIINYLSTRQQHNCKEWRLLFKIWLAKANRQNKVGDVTGLCILH
jgi:predicted transcriptional regulator